MCIRNCCKGWSWSMWDEVFCFWFHFWRVHCTQVSDSRPLDLLLCVKIRTNVIVGFGGGGGLRCNPPLVGHFFWKRVFDIFGLKPPFWTEWWIKVTTRGCTPFKNSKIRLKFSIFGTVSYMETSQSSILSLSTCILVYYVEALINSVSAIYVLTEIK